MKTPLRALTRFVVLAAAIHLVLQFRYLNRTELASLSNVAIAPEFSISETHQSTNTQPITRTSKSKAPSLSTVAIAPEFSTSETNQSTNTNTQPITRTSKSKAAQCVRTLISDAKAKVAALPPTEIETAGHQVAPTPTRRNKQRKQILYLHPGPPKTATTTIQQLLTDHQTLLHKDNIYLVGKVLPDEHWHCNFPLFVKCMAFDRYGELERYQQQQQQGKAADEDNNSNNNQDPAPPTTCATSLEDQLDEYYKEGADVILTDEQIGIRFARLSLTPDHVQRVQEGTKDFFSDIVGKHDWEVRLLLGYRPYFDFVKSQFGQKNNSRGAKPKFLNWPGVRRGAHIAPLSQNLLNDDYDWPTTQRLAETFRPYVDSIHVFDITNNNDHHHQNEKDKEDFTVHFFCHLLQDADAACQAQKALVASPQEAVQANKAIQLEYDRIATAAADAGLVDTTKFQRQHLGPKVRQYMNARKIQIKDLPMECPTQEVADELLEQSLQLEKEVFPERAPHWRSKDLFETAMKQQKFCNVDVAKVLQDEDWKGFWEACRTPNNFNEVACGIFKDNNSKRILDDNGKGTMKEEKQEAVAVAGGITATLADDHGKSLTAATIALADDGEESSSKDPPVVAYAVSFIQCSGGQNNAAGLVDASLVLRHSVHQNSVRNPASGSRYDYKMYAIVHKQAEECSATLKHAGFEILLVEPPVKKSEIRGDYLRKNIHKELCCGHDEFIKLYAYNMIPEEIFVHVDIDFAFFKPMDHLFDAIHYDKDSEEGQRARSLIEREFETDAWPDKIDAFITRDWSQMAPNKFPPGYQAGFMVGRHNEAAFDRIIEVIKEGNYTDGWGWKSGWGSLGYGGYVGARAMQGLIAYYYDHIDPGTTVELNQCRYNHMGLDIRYNGVPNFHRKYGKKGQCRNNNKADICEDCMVTPREKIYSIHYTMCRKPWTCVGTGTMDGKRVGSRERATAVDLRISHLDHCMMMHNMWHEMRYDLESKLLNLTGDETIREGMSGAYKKDIFHGHCSKDGGYLNLAGTRETYSRFDELYGPPAK